MCDKRRARKKEMIKLTGFLAINTPIHSHTHTHAHTHTKTKPLTYPLAPSPQTTNLGCPLVQKTRVEKVSNVTHQEVDGAGHAVVFALVVQDRPVLEQPLQQLLDRLDERQALSPHHRVLLEQVRHPASNPRNQSALSLLDLEFLL